MDVFFPSFLPLTSQAPQLGDVVHLGSDPVHQQHDNGLISDHVLIYSKDCFSYRIGEQHCVAAEGEAEMCQIKGKKYRVIFLTGPALKMSLDWPPPKMPRLDLCFDRISSMATGRGEILNTCMKAGPR